MKVKGIKKAISESKKDSKLAKRYYYNLKTKEVWLDVFENYNLYNEYYSPNIVEVARGEQTQKTLLENIKEAIAFIKYKRKNYDY